jgi:hypothetical protein
MRGRVALLVAMAACSHGSGNATTVGPEGSGTRVECSQHSECVGAGVTCCDCPTFAVPASDASHQACEGVRCPYKHCPRNVRPACDEGRCILACVAMECRLPCLFGFATDASGCLTCACAFPDLPGCTQAADCVRVRADCCGCERGGHDTAVLQRDASEHDADLHCPVMPQCPAANTCDDAETPQCIQSRCVLTTAASLPANACGRFDLPACPVGQVCVVNGPDAAAHAAGLGVCMVGASLRQDPPTP